jgi:hypothetical protein
VGWFIACVAHTLAAAFVAIVDRGYFDFGSSDYEANHL